MKLNPSGLCLFLIGVVLTISGAIASESGLIIFGIVLMSLCFIATAYGTVREK